MTKLDEKQTYLLVLAYYNERKNQAKVIETLLQPLRGDIQEAKQLCKARLTPNELDAEASYVALETIAEAKANGNAYGFEQKFFQRLRQELRKYTTTKQFVDIGEVTITDPSPNPEEAYALKEQINLVREYLKLLYAPHNIEWFTRRFANGESTQAIANDYNVTKQAVSKTTNVMKTQVEKYMREMNA